MSMVKGVSNFTAVNSRKLCQCSVFEYDSDIDFNILIQFFGSCNVENAMLFKGCKINLLSAG